MGGLFTKDTVILDITSRLITAIVGVRKAPSVFDIKAICENEHYGYENGVLVDEEDTFRTLKQTLREAMSKANSRAKTVYVGVPAEFATVVTKEVSITLDRKRRVVDEDIEFLLKKGNDFDSNEYTVVNTSAIYYSIDNGRNLYSDVRDMSASRVDAGVSYMLASKQLVSDVEACIMSLGFKDVRFIATSWAEGVALLDSEQRDGVYMLIDVGFASTSVSIAKGDGLLDLKSFSLGGAHIAADICEVFGVSPEAALEAKKLVDINLQYGENDALVREGDTLVNANTVCEIVKYRWDMIGDMLSKILLELGDAAPSYMHIYLTGEGISDMRGVKQYLAKCIGKNIEILLPRQFGFTHAEDSSKTALLHVAGTLQSTGVGAKIKNLLLWR